ncbi:MAG TPA: TA system VapC family ribonuclease toxin [Thermoanaerobaculia bacterium]|nr:TA system VapC family ribonuclease toxin [Thermoanaerobaculia bacterium]
MVSLLDINVLVALAWPLHIHHELASRWFRRHQRSGWATCPLTQSGFVRVSSNQKAIRDAKPPREAAFILRRILALPPHVFFSDDISLVASGFVDPEKLTGHRQVTDAHLLGVALRHGSRLATLDRGILDLVPSGFSAREAVHVLGTDPL